MSKLAQSLAEASPGLKLPGDSHRSAERSSIADPALRVSQLDLLTPAERQQLLVGWNQTAAEYPRQKSIHTLFEEQAESTPDATAAECGSQRLTYRELDRRAEALAVELLRTGITPEAHVGLFLERSLDMLVGVLGVLKSGGTYVPLDPSFPRDRLAFMVEDARIPVLVTQQRLVSELPPHEARVVCVDALAPATNRSASRPARPSHQLAYVLYTSGSTGRPKGVQISHRAVVNFLYSMRRAPGLGADDVLLAITTLSFDIAGLELLLPLVTGARVVIAPRDIAVDGPRLAELIEQCGATVMQATPATWRMLIDSGWQGSQRLKLLCGGEAFGADLTEPLLARCGELWNMYGPTETTIWSTTGQILPGQTITIGRPIANTQVYILDTRSQPVPVGVAGELFIGGDGVARGYLNRPELTRERFLVSPFDPTGQARLYRTGDLARFRADGRIEFLGRADHQVKIRGFRIELGEIEAALAAAEGVAQAVVVVREDSPGDKRLVAYIVPRMAALAQTGFASGSRSHEPQAGAPPVAQNGSASAVVPAAELRATLRLKLPEYMVPSTFVFLERLPLTPNGKVDRKALPRPEASGTEAEQNYEAPQGPTEEKLGRIMASLLKLPQVGRKGSFFDLGGHSILAVALFNEVEREFGKRLPLATLFRAPTIEQLSKVLDVPAGPSAGWPSLVAIRAQGSKPRFFCVHGAGGNLLLYRDLVRHLGDDYPFYGLQSQGLDGKAAPLRSIEEMASRYAREIRELQPEGPYCLGGYCLGGAIAYQIARLLRQEGHDVPLLALLDTYNFSRMEPPTPWLYVRQKAAFHLSNVARLGLRHWPGYFSSKLREARDGEFAGLLNTIKKSRRRRGPSSIQTEIHEVNDQAAAAFQPKPCSAPVTLFKPRVNYACFPDARMGWGELAAGGLDIVELPVNPHAMLVEPYVRHLAEALRQRLDRVQRALPNPNLRGSGKGDLASGPVITWPAAHLTRPPALRRGQVNVQCLWIHEWSSSLGELERWLSADERARADRFHSQGDRERFVVRSALARRVLSGHAGCSAGDLRFVAGPKGKPILAVPPGPERITFSVSEAGGLALLAVALDLDVGIDVEAVRPMGELAGIANTHFAPSEAAALAGLPEKARAAAFYRFWTAKEAVLKATGDGIGELLHEVEVGLSADFRPRLVQMPAGWPPAADWSLHSLDPAEGYVGALAVPRPSIEPKTWWLRPG